MSLQNPYLSLPFGNETLRLLDLGGRTPVVDQSQVIFYDDFSVGSTLPWVKTVGTGGTLARSTTVLEWSQGGASFKWTSGTTASEVQTAARRFGTPPNANVVAYGLRFWMLDESPDYFRFTVGKRDGTNYVRGVLEHKYSTNVWGYDAGGAGAESISTLLTRDANDSTTIPVWHNVLVVVDFANAKYRLIAIDDSIHGGSTGTNVSSTSLRTAADATLPGTMTFELEFKNTGTPAAANICIDLAYGVILA